MSAGPRGDIAAILLPMNGASTDEAALTLGFDLARRFSANLQALHVATDSREVAPLAGEGLSGAMVEEMMSVAERESLRRTTRARTLFDAALAQGGTAAVTRTDRLPLVGLGTARTPTASFRTIVGREHELVAHAARLSDLIVIPHPDSDDAISSSEALHAVLFDSGRPVIIAPKQAPTSIGRRVCIAWNGTAESAAAVLSGLCWMHAADAVQVLYSDDYQRRGPEASELVDYLAGHGINATKAAFKPRDGNVGAGLLAATAAFECDLLAMGAYSHSRLRQLILGGVTRHVIGKAPLPVLMAR
ncbi:universal stress protein [Lichenicola sp.]|uniref:universal stress protein n=1 Tax=Lichenicola sp. TaxID=2804529 RepID=UPI003B00C4F2